MTKNIDEMLRDIKRTQKNLFNEDEIELMQGITGELKEGGKEILMALLHNKKSKGKMLNEIMTPLDDYFDMMRGIDETIRTNTNPESVLPMKCLYYPICIDVMYLGGITRGFTDEQMKYRADFFNRRDELPKDNAFRRFFVEAYIDEEVYNRFYIGKEAGRLESEDAEKYTPEGAKKWDEHYNALCNEYGESEYKRIYDDPAEYYPHTTSEDALDCKSVANFTREGAKYIEQELRREGVAL